eukprot:scaffold93974_cov60-Phaeocystis_antarctica.AAC.2
MPTHALLSAESAEVSPNISSLPLSCVTCVEYPDEHSSHRHRGCWTAHDTGQSSGEPRRSPRRRLSRCSAAAGWPVLPCPAFFFTLRANEACSRRRCYMRN